MCKSMQDLIEEEIISLSRMQVHCVQAFGRLEEVLREEAPLPDGLILHSWGGNAAQVRGLARLEGVHFSISGHSITGSRKKIRSMLKEVHCKSCHIPNPSVEAIDSQSAKL